MLARYHIVRGRKLTELPAAVRRGRRIDTRKHTRHFLRPPEPLVRTFLSSSPKDRTAAWPVFERSYLALIAQRFAEDRTPFDELARLALTADVFLGCNCPTANNPDVQRCHTVLALRFMAGKYPKLEMRLP